MNKPLPDGILMTQHSHQTAPTQFVEANGIRFAYRRFGKAGGVPLSFSTALHRHHGLLGPYGGGWLALRREVILSVTRASPAARRGASHVREDGR